MTETPKSAARLLAEAASIAGFRAADGWPAELNPRQLAALMAGGWKEPHKGEYRIWGQMIADAIKAENLTLRRQSRPPVEIARDAGDLSEYDRFRKAVFPSLDRLGRARLVYYEKREQPDTLHIDRNQCAAWLRAIGEQPSEHIRAWIGPAWQDEAPKVGAGKTAPSADSRPGERRDYFRSLWLELNKPARNDGIWKAIRSRAGKSDCPITSAPSNEEFVFQYSDGGTDRLDRSIFQKDMSAVRKG